MQPEGGAEVLPVVWAASRRSGLGLCLGLCLGLGLGLGLTSSHVHKGQTELRERGRDSARDKEGEIANSSPRASRPPSHDCGLVAWALDLRLKKEKTPSTTHPPTHTHSPSLSLLLS